MITKLKEAFKTPVGFFILLLNGVILLYLPLALALITDNGYWFLLYPLGSLTALFILIVVVILKGYE